MSKFVKLLNADEEWLPLTACWSNDHDCDNDDKTQCGTDDTCTSDDNDICGYVADSISVGLPTPE